jgi:parvulin-like peptidyl-prolyl isomerase
MGKFRLWTLIAVAGLVGVICSELLCRWAVFRGAAGHLFGRGRLIAIASGTGLYEKDLDGNEVFTASELVAAENLRRAAKNEQTDQAKIDRELSLLRAQFGSEKAFVRALGLSGLSRLSLREKIADQSRSLQWIEKQISRETTATDQECRKFYEAHRELFPQPVRFRASHLFLAAPNETLPEVVDPKQKAIEALALRLAHGESLAQLAAETSEDEATKSRGGDLGFFSASRMPPEFFAEVQKLHAGQTSKPFRSHLGFHIVQVTEIKTARLLRFEEARGEIALAIANERRALIAEALAETLGRADYVRAD